MIEKEYAVSDRANNDESRPDTAKEVLNSDVINGYAYRASLFEHVKSAEKITPIIEAGLDD